MFYSLSLSISFYTPGVSFYMDLGFIIATLIFKISSSELNVNFNTYNVIHVNRNPSRGKYWVGEKQKLNRQRTKYRNMNIAILKTPNILLYCWKDSNVWINKHNSYILQWGGGKLCGREKLSECVGIFNTCDCTRSGFFWLSNPSYSVATVLWMYKYTDLNK